MCLLQAHNLLLDKIILEGSTVQQYLNTIVLNAHASLHLGDSPHTASADSWYNMAKDYL